MAQTDIKLTLDWRFEGPAAGFLLAQDKGYFADEGLNVTVDTGNGSVEAIPRVATGAYQFGFGDINSLIKFLDEDASQPVKAVMMVYDKPVFSVIARRQEAGRTAPGWRVCAMACLCRGCRYRYVGHHARVDRLPRARADAGLWRCGWRLRLCLFGDPQPQGERGAGR
jgi:hypothetical protein